MSKSKTGEAPSPLSFVLKNVWAFLAGAALIFAAFVIAGRHSVERANRSVEIVADFSALSDFAKSNCLDFHEMLLRFKSAGLTSVSFSEETVEDMALSGRLSLVFGRELAGSRAFPSSLTLSPEKLYAVVYSPDCAAMLESYSFLSIKDMRKVWSPPAVSSETPALFEFSVSRKALESSFCGFSSESVRLCRSMGFGIILRPENRQNLSPDEISRFLFMLRDELGAEKFIFSGSDNDVIGYPSCIDDTAAVIRKGGMVFGIMEAANAKAMQKGIQTIALKCPDLAVRVMTIPPLQQRRLSVESMIEKYSLGMRERNIRVLFIRPHLALPGNVSAEELNLSYISGIRRAAEENGLVVGRALPFPAMEYPVQSALFLSFGVLCSFCFLCGRLKCGKPVTIALLVVWAVVSVALIASGRLSLYRKLSAFAAGVSFPIIAMHLNFDSFRALLSEASPMAAWRKSSAALLGIVLLSASGGLFIAALLAGPEFYVQADMFRGIKLLMLLPPAVVVLLWIAGSGGFAESIRELLGKSVKFGHALVAFVLAGAGGYLLLRTGNTSEGAVSKTELSLRSFLMGVFTIRPRFKEFLIGFPAVMCFSSLRLFGLERLSWILVLAASIGAADVTDTFAHIHTPVAVGLARVFGGAVLGWLIGSALLFCLFWASEFFFEKKKEKEKK